MKTGQKTVRFFNARKQDIPSVLCGAVFDLDLIGTYLCYRICKNDRDLSHGQPCTDSLCNLRKQGAGNDRTELSKVTVCTGLPGIFDHDMRRNICGTHTGNLSMLARISLRLFDERIDMSK